MAKGGDVDDDSSGQGEGMGAAFWLMLCLGILGLLGFLIVGAGASVGAI